MEDTNDWGKMVLAIIGAIIICFALTEYDKYTVRKAQQKIQDGILYPREP